MREFSKSEIFRYKCPVCGSLNKRHIPILYKGNVHGFDLHCCNCGYVAQFVQPPKNVGAIYTGFLTEDKVENQRCYALNKCPHTSCPLYGSYNPDENSGYEDEQGDGYGNDGDDSGSGNHPLDTDQIHLGVYGDTDNLEPYKLKIKIEEEGKPFR